MNFCMKEYSSLLFKRNFGIFSLALILILDNIRLKIQNQTFVPICSLSLLGNWVLKKDLDFVVFSSQPLVILVIFTFFYLFSGNALTDRVIK